MTNLKHTYLYNIILAICIGMLIIYFLPSFFSKYQVKFVEQNKIITDAKITWFADLNNDGFSEKINKSHNSNSHTPCLVIMDKDELFLEQWNVLGEWINISPLMIGDYDNNGFSEIFALSFNNDSIFINGYEPYKENGYEIKSRFVFNASLSNGKQDWYVHSNNFIDLNDDDFKEVVFTFRAGFTKQPRRVVAYDIKNDTILMSPFAGITVIESYYCDIDSDGKPEICGETSATNNYDKHVNLTDTNSYLLIYDHNLELKYFPDTNYGIASNVSVVPFKNKIASLWLGRTTYNHKRILKIYNNEDGILNSIEKDISDLFKNKPQMLVAKRKSEDILFLIGNDRIIEIDENLEQISNIDIESYLSDLVKTFDFENDGTDEFVFVSNLKNKICIYRNGFVHPVSIDIKESPSTNIEVSVRKVKGNHDQISIQYGQYWYLYEYFKNPNYIYRCPSYFMIFFLLFVFFQLLFWFYKGRIQKQYETERKLMELQLLTVKNQMNPHFTFNALTSISSIIYKEDKKLAYDFLTRFSDLIRSTLENAESISVSLDAELKFVENYLELEKFRFKDKFNYSIDVKDDIDIQTPIPRMIIQTFVENALKHGLMHKEKGGLLNINLWKEKNLLLIEIEDNGIGRQKAKEVSLGSTGKGLKIIEQIVLLYKKLQGKEIKYKVIDLYKDEMAAGTKVVIEISI